MKLTTKNFISNYVNRNSDLVKIIVIEEGFGDTGSIKDTNKNTISGFL